MIRSSREEGTVLISTLLILSLMSAVALGLIATLRQSTQKVQSLAETAQADLYAQGAEAFARSFLDQLGEAEPEVVNAQLRTAEPVLLPFENGSIALSIRDGTHCLRLGNLVTAEGQASDTDVLRLTRLFKVLGIAPGEATGLANRLADWVDADTTLRPGGAEDGAYLFRNPPNRTANVAFSSLSELRAIEGMTEEIYQTVRPYLCIGTRVSNEAYIFNLDTATSEHLPVIAALLGDEGNNLALAAEILAARPPDGYGSQEALEATAALQNLDADDRIDISALGFVTDRVEIEALITFGQIERARMFGFDGVDKGDVKLTYRDWGRSAFRPDLSTRRNDNLGR